MTRQPHTRNWQLTTSIDYYQGKRFIEVPIYRNPGYLLPTLATPSIANHRLLITEDSMDKQSRGKWNELMRSGEPFLNELSPSNKREWLRLSVRWVEIRKGKLQSRVLETAFYLPSR
ncbi:hypothetical protein AMTR_s01945p00007750 [Amborella trichopoda]|uniref:Uncharacterized protein n=1 Tax=Amborella trichopoda TaxID=13333 RepID=W1PKY0_AMBTC|nr:hypothetical protein AMTR_s01945p00007750 [Amborella trichopoda]